MREWAEDGWDDRVDTSCFPIVIIRSLSAAETPESLARLFWSLSQVLAREERLITVNEVSTLGQFDPGNITITARWLREHAAARRRLAVAEALICDAPAFRFVLSALNAAVPRSNIAVFPTGDEAVGWIRTQADRARLPPIPMQAWPAVRALGARRPHGG